ncbi:unnamed protein product, partial [Meganyctiphanes norvegica]
KFRQYQKEGNTEDMLKYIYKTNGKEILQFLPMMDITNESKDESISTKLREEGNVFFRRKKLQEALKKYNECIFSSPHPKLSFKEIDKKMYTPLAMGYGNRSAVLLQLKEYELCICDIDRSLNLCNSKITQFKLEERKVKCLIGIERYQEAQELLKTCKLLLNTLQLEEKVKECYRNALSKLLQQCAQGIKRGTFHSQNKKQKSKYDEIKYADASASFSNDDLIFTYNNPTPPSLDDEPNPTIPAFSCTLKLQYSSDQGKYVVATRDIKPGEVIAVETPYTSCIDPEEPNSPLSFCTFCLARCAAPIPCWECTNVVFCNEECRSKGWDTFHMKECPVYSQLNETAFIKAYRIIAGQSVEELKDFVSKLHNEEQRSPLEQMFNEDQIYDSHSYRSVYFLEDNIQTVTTEVLIRSAFKALMLTQLLIKSNRYFIANAGDKYVLNEEDVIFIGSLFIRHILGTKYNSFKILETHAIDNKSNLSKKLVGVGSGTYVAESLFNHSCIPSAMILFYKNVGVCRSSQFIPSGSQVYVSYAKKYYQEPDRSIRRKKLYDDWCFNCSCDACESDCRLSYSDVKESLNLFTVSKLRTKDRRVSRNNLERTASLKLELDTLGKRNQSLVMRWVNCPCSYENNDLDLVMESIEFFDRFV